MKTIILLATILISGHSFAVNYTKCDLQSAMGEELEFESLSINQTQSIITLKRGYLLGHILYVLDRVNSDENFLGGVDYLYLKYNNSSLISDDEERNEELRKLGRTMVDINTVPLNKVIGLEFSEPMSEEGITAYGMVTYGDFEMALLVNCQAE